MKIENKDFWEKDNIIETQDLSKKVSDFELFMFKEASERYQNFGKIDSIKIFGCGTGREIESIVNFYHPTRVVASDIAENMITKCKQNLKLWNIDGITETVVGDATAYNKVYNEFDLVTILNSMLTYVPVKQDRLTIFKNSLQILKPKGTLIGTVHNQQGTPAKTYYFRIRNFFSFILGEKAGNRSTGFKGYKVSGYYYDKKGLVKEIHDAGFENIEVYSLEEFYHSKGQEYNRKKGYNNLIFIATKP